MKNTIFILLLFISVFSLDGQIRHTLPPLPYGADALEPVMSTETINYHHGKHVQTYVDNLNKLIPGTRYAEASLDEISRTADGGIYNNGAQILNHIIFFDGFAPENRAMHNPHGELSAAIDRSFGSFENFKKEFQEKAAAQFASGWAWLVTDDNGNISIRTTSNAVNPLKEGYIPLLGIDVWEHSYYIDYRNSRADYLENIWRIVDWDVIGRRYMQRDYSAR